MRTFLLCLGLSLSACPKPPPPATFTAPTDSVELPIPDREWDEKAPPEGWCGETCIQMAALHYGAWVPQAAANKAGHPKTPDLWEQDLPVAMNALGMTFESAPREGTVRMLEWTVKSLRKGTPVIIGVKLVPSKHPDWEVDHLVLAVGFSPEGLLVNSNLEGQQRLAWNALLTKEGSKQYSLVNDKGTTWGFAVTGIPGAKPNTRADVIYEMPEAVTLRFETADAGTEDLTVPRDAVYGISK
ncbi:MAG: hypothetical protein QM817_37690 [Archangium sp.]